MSDTAAYKNTDREIWRGADEGNGSYYADSIHVTIGGAIGIDCGGHVIVRPVRDWHHLAVRDNEPSVTPADIEKMIAEFDPSRVTKCDDGTLRTYYSGYDLTAIAEYIAAELANR